MTLTPLPKGSELAEKVPAMTPTPIATDDPDQEAGSVALELGLAIGGGRGDGYTRGELDPLVALALHLQERMPS